MCICHSLKLYIEHAFSKFPSNIGFILTEVTLWLSSNVIRGREDSKALFKIMNPADEENIKERDVPLPHKKLSKT